MRPTPWRAEGEVVGWSCTQAVPVNSHVSLFSIDAPVTPPNKRTTLFVASQVISVQNRDGGAWVSERLFQRPAENAHVSLRFAPDASRPPNRSSPSAAGSYANPKPNRSEGAGFEVMFIQSPPWNFQVSLKY